ncbi:MAG: barstar family protein, partial [Betaproteobacteria bacterium]
VVGAGGKRALLDALAGALEFPPHFGGNWDALYDCLTDLDLADQPGLVLEIAGLSRFAHDDPRGLAVAFGTFADAARYWAERRACFVVLIGGAGRVASTLAPLEDQGLGR